WVARPCPDPDRPEPRHPRDARGGRDVTGLPPRHKPRYGRHLQPGSHEILRPLALLLALLLAWPAPAAALSLIRDAEIERTLDRIAAPILRAAGLNPAAVNLYIVNSREMNAFVA